MLSTGIQHILQEKGQIMRKRPAWTPLTGSVFEVPGCQVRDAIDRVIGDP